MTDQFTILAADDDGMNLEMIEIILSELDCRLLKAENGRQVVDLLIKDPCIDTILLDLEMPVMDGYEALRQIKQNADWSHIPVIVVTAESSQVTRTLAFGANDFISKPYNPEELRLRVMNHVRSKRLFDITQNMNHILEGEVAKKTAALQCALSRSKKAELEISLRLGRASEFRDQETGMHTRRISELSKHLARLAGFSDEQCEVLQLASPLHDVGKIGIPDHVLMKPGKLDESEFEIMKQHSEIGHRILSDADDYSIIHAGGIIALQHHERWDGSGYPQGLKGEEISAFARIVSIVDVFDALCSDRPYKNAFPLEKTIEILQEGRGSFFDPTLLDLFLGNSADFVVIREGLQDSSDEQSRLCI